MAHKIEPRRAAHTMGHGQPPTTPFKRPVKAGKPSVSGLGPTKGNKSGSRPSFQNKGGAPKATVPRRPSPERLKGVGK